MDMVELAEAIRRMNRQSGLYKVLKRELTALGYWQNKPRGNPKKGYQAYVKRKANV